MQKILRTTDKNGDFIFEHRYYVQPGTYFPAVKSERVEVRHGVVERQVELHDPSTGKYLGVAQALDIPVQGWTHNRGINLETYKRGKTFFLVVDGEAAEFDDFRELVRCFDRLEQQAMKKEWED